MNRIWESKNSLPGVMVLAALAVARPRRQMRNVECRMQSAARRAVAAAWARARWECHVSTRRCSPQ